MPAMLLVAATASCAGSSLPPLAGVEATSRSAKVRFDRSDYVFDLPVSDKSGKKLIDISCHSLGDARRERYAEETGSDPVADLSCYVKDLARANEYTMLGISGESLQFTPGFFWFSRIGGCRSYRMDAKLRGVSISFAFSNIDPAQRTADMTVEIAPWPSAKDDVLNSTNHSAQCLK